MRVLVDTSIWSLALRRTRKQIPPAQRSLQMELSELILEGRVVMIGPVRQELLSGLSDPATFNRLREHLQHFEDEPLQTGDFEEAARISKLCRSQGTAGSAVDFLICAVALRRDLPVFTADHDFQLYTRCCPVRLYTAVRSGQ